MDIILNKLKRMIPAKIFKKVQPGYHFLLSWLSATLYRSPSNKLIVIGVTGTTGKTSSVYLIAKMLEGAGYRVGYTSTAMFSDGKKEWLNDKKMTMVGRLYTQKMIKRMVSHKCRYAVIESTSEGMRQFRHRFINYDVLVFTGLYPEHIESHGSFENYKKAKGELFKHLERCSVKYVDNNKEVQRPQKDLKKLDLERIKKTVIANLEDEHVGYFLDFPAERRMGYISADKDLDRSSVPENTEVIQYRLKSDHKAYFTAVLPGNAEEGIDINIDIFGTFNSSNAMNAFGAGISQGIEPLKIKEGLEKVEGLPGRLEKIDLGQEFYVVVDYAFEPNALTKSYDTLQGLDHKRTIHVLGSAGGGRDTSRRPRLGKLAGERADIVIVTNEDPYDEDPASIMDQVAAGAEEAGKRENKDLFKIEDRREAIKKALELANKDDLVLITGKGSEQGICVAGGRMIPWDDRKVVREEIREKIKEEKNSSREESSF